MGKYSVGISTQNKIIDCCKTLFYQKGIHKTSYEEICSAADINRGLIPYYFKSKNNIGTAIYQEFIDNADRLISEVCGADENTRFICTMAFYFDLMKRDPNLCRFYFEVESNAFWAEYTLQLQYSIIDRLLNFNKISVAPEARRTIACMSEGVEKEIVHGIESGFLLEDAWTIAVRDSDFIFQMIGLSSEQSAKYRSLGREIYNRYSLYCGPDFSLSLRLR